MRGATNRMLVAISMLATACSGGGLPPTDSASGAPTTDDGALVMTSTPETDAAVAGMVTLEEGGTVEAEAADGTTFVLLVPPQAVAEDTEITLTPLGDIGGLGLDGPVYGVQLAPDGLELYEYARLAITPPEPIRRDELLAFVASDDGTEIELALVDPASEPVVLLLEHFTKAGAGGATPEQQATFKAKSATNSQQRLSAELRDRIKNQDTTDLADFTDRYHREVLDPLKEAASLDCRHLETYLESGILFERALQLIGLSSEEEAASLQRVADVITFAEPRYDECEQEAIDRCRADENPRILVEFWLSWADVETPPPGMEERAEQICRPQALQFEMSGSGTSTAGGDSVEVSWEFWGLKCEGTEEWMIWENVETDSGFSTRTGAPGEDPYGPVFATFGEDGVVEDGARWRGAGEADPLSQSPPGWGTLTGTIFTLVPADDPTEVTATIRQGGFTDTAPVEPWDGSFGECPEADAD